MLVNSTSLKKELERTGYALSLLSADNVSVVGVLKLSAGTVNPSQWFQWKREGAHGPLLQLSSWAEVTASQRKPKGSDHLRGMSRKA